MVLHIIVTAILLLFSSLVYAIPFDGKATPPDPNIRVTCKDYVFTNQTSATSPNGHDCMDLVNAIQYGGLWAGSGEQEQLANNSACAFGLEPFEDPSGDAFLVDNGDIVAIIMSAIVTIERDSPHIGANGTMSCKRPDNSGFVDKVKWRIYGTNE